jgi:hypothetical protein
MQLREAGAIALVCLLTDAHSTQLAVVGDSLLTPHPLTPCTMPAGVHDTGHAYARTSHAAA